MTLPNPNGSGRLNQNSGEIENLGVEAQLGYRKNGIWSVDGNYSFLHMENPVIAAPEHKLYVGARWLDIWARGENLLAQKYEINAGHPMPRATIMAGINVNF